MRSLTQNDKTWSCSECLWTWKASPRQTISDATQQATFFFNAHNCRRHPRPEADVPNLVDTQKLRAYTSLEKL